MTIKTKVIISCIALLVAFTTGRYSVNTPTVKTEEEQTVEAQKDVETKKVTTITKDPKGNDVTVITEDTTIKANTDTKTQIEQTVTPPKKNTLNISALAGLGLSNSFQPVYGLSITKSVIGPVTAGIYGMNNGVLGISIGLNF